MSFKSKFLIVLLAILLGILLACEEKKKDNLSPAEAKISLGHFLFFEKKLSKDGTKACSTCHNPAFAFTDDYRVAHGLEATLHHLNTPTLINSKFNQTLSWENPNMFSFEEQMDIPLFGTAPPEMGLHQQDSSQILGELRQTSYFEKHYERAFPKQKMTWLNAKKALVAYVKSLESFESPYDKYMRGDSTALDISQKKGMNLFFSEELSCAICHPPPHFTLASQAALSPQRYFFNVGLYDESEWKSMENRKKGLSQFTKNASDVGKFRVPTLRNLAFTAPYMHDGSIAQLGEVLKLMNKKRYLQINNNFHIFVEKQTAKTLEIAAPLSDEQHRDLINFLWSLSDSTVLTNPHFINPFLYEN